MRVYDIFTNTFVDDDEERKRRELEQKRMGETEVGKTEVTTYADGSQTRTQTTEIPSQQTVMRPGQEGQFMRPIMRGPVNPNDFQRILNIESGNRQFNQQGQVLTSPKGAMGIAQVMPSTAMNPGYGVPNIFDYAASQGINVPNRDEQTAKQLLSNQQLNQGFGQLYHNAMVQKFGPEAGAAAYNAGPGRTQQAMAQSQQTGQPYTQFLPKETQQYVQQFNKGQQQQGPVSPQQLQQQIQQPVQQAQPSLLGPGLKIPGILGMPTQENMLQNKITEYQNIGDNVDQLLKYGLSENTPDYLQVRAKNRAAELLNETRNLEKAKTEVAQMDESALGKVLREKTTGGNWAKYVAFNLLGMETLALEEAAKLGIGREVSTTINGKPALVKMAANGLPLEGYDATTGEKLDSKQLVMAADNLRNVKGAQQSNDVYSDPTGKIKGNFVLERREGGGAPVFKEVGTGRVATVQESQSLQKLGVGGGLDYQRQQQVQRKNIDLQADWEKGRIQAIQAGPIAANKWMGEFNAKHGTNYPPSQINGSAPQIDVATGTLTQQPSIVTQQGQPGGVQGTTTKETPAQVERRNKLAETRSEGLAKYYDETLTKESASGDKVSGIRKRQLELFNNPRVNMANIFGLATGAGRPPGDQQWTIVRDILSGKFAKDTEGQAVNPQQLSQRLAALGLSPEEINVIYQYDIMNRELLGETLRDTSGAGSVSNIEQQMNKDRQVDITRAPAYGAYNIINQTKFDGDRMRYKSDWAADKEFKSIAEFNKEWRKESKRINDLYMAQSKARLDFIQKQPGGVENVNAVREAYRRFPVPEYDPDTMSWKKTKPLSEILR